MEVTITEGDQSRLWREATDNLEAYEKLPQGIDHFIRYTKEYNILVQNIFEEVITFDPEYPKA